MDEPDINSPLARWKWTMTWAPSTTGAAFAVLNDLALRSGKTGSCWPSHSTIAEKTGLSVNGVRKAIRQLEDLGAISAEGSGGRKANGAGCSRTYSLNLSLQGHVNVLPQGQVNGSTCPAGVVNVSRPSRQRVPPVSSTCPASDNKGGFERGLEGGRKEGAAAAPSFLDIVKSMFKEPPPLGDDNPERWLLVEAAGIAQDLSDRLKNLPLEGLVELIRRRGISCLIRSVRKTEATPSLLELFKAMNEAVEPTAEELGHGHLRGVVNTNRQSRSERWVNDSDLTWLAGKAVTLKHNGTDGENAELLGEWKAIEARVTRPLILHVCDELKRLNGKMAWPSEVHYRLNELDEDLVC